MQVLPMRFQQSVLSLLLCAAVAPPVPADELAAVRRVTFRLTYTVTPRDVATQVTLVAVVPRSLPGHQKVLGVRYSPRPERIFDEGGNRYAQFGLRNFARSVEVRIEVDAELYRCDLSGLTQRKGTGKPDASPATRRWLAAEKYVEKDAPEIRALARRAGGKTDLEVVRGIVDVVRGSLRYTGFNERDVGALGGLKSGQGDCTEYSDLFAALCRARNIPTRIWEGYVTADVQPGDTPNHIWVEVNLKDHGWVPIDPLRAALGQSPLDRMRNVYVYISDVRNDPVLHGGHAFYYTYRGRPVEARSEFRIKKQEDLTRP